MHTRTARGDSIHKTRISGSAVTATQQRPMHLLPQRCMSKCTSCRAAIPAEVIHAVRKDGRNGNGPLLGRVQAG